MNEAEEKKLPTWLRRLNELGAVYEVGGQVRDRLLGLPVYSKDQDYVITGIPLEDLRRELQRFGRVDLVGRSFGVIKFTPPHPPDSKSVTYDVALPRKEFSTGVGHRDFAVEFDHTCSIEDDLIRRDFTINALARRVGTDELIDPTGGQKDIEQKLIRYINERAFREDPLRILRAVQFAARFNFSLEENTAAALQRHVQRLTSVSAERIAEELNKLLLKAEQPSNGFRLMQELGMLEVVLPELAACVDVDQPGPFHAYDVFEHTIRTVDAAPARLRVRWAALLHDINKPQARVVEGDRATFYGHEKRGATTARQVLRRLRYANEFIRDVSLLVDRHMFTTDVTDKGVRRLIRRLGADLIFDLLDLRRADVVAQGRGGTTDDVDELEARIREEISRKRPFGLRDLAIDGNDLMDHLQVPPGPIIGKILNHLLELVLDDPERNTREALLQLASEYHRELTS